MEIVVINLYLLFVFCSHFCFTFGLNELKFYTGVLCDVESRMDHQCSVFVAEIKKFNECVFKCGRDPACIGASSTASQGGCVHHYTCNELSECSTEDHNHEYVSKNCAHNGVWIPKSMKCSCRDGWIGETCLDLPKECLDLTKHGYMSRRAYMIIQLPLDNSPTIAAVDCRLARSSTWTAVRIFTNSGGNFNRTWEEYKTGFYESSDNFWLGLENWHKLSMAGYREVTLAMSFGRRYRRYYNFQVNGESEHYSFTFGSTRELYRQNYPYVNRFADCLGPLLNKPFVTKDINLDCAGRVGSGWWHESGVCTTTSTSCNLLGIVPKYWDVDVPDYQRMRVNGIDPEVIKKESYVAMYLYIRR